MHLHKFVFMHTRIDAHICIFMMLAQSFRSAAAPKRRQRTHGSFHKSGARKQTRPSSRAYKKDTHNKDPEFIEIAIDIYIYIYTYIYIYVRIHVCICTCMCLLIF